MSDHSIPIVPAILIGQCCCGLKYIRMPEDDSIASLSTTPAVVSHSGMPSLYINYPLY